MMHAIPVCDMDDDCLVFVDGELDGIYKRCAGEFADKTVEIDESDGIMAASYAAGDDGMEVRYRYGGTQDDGRRHVIPSDGMLAIPIQCLDDAWSYVLFSTTTPRYDAITSHIGSYKLVRVR